RPPTPPLFPYTTLFRSTASRLGTAPQDAGPALGSGSVSVAVDKIARLGAVVSGKVTFSDGNTAEWYFDQAGRLGLLPQQPGYRPDRKSTRLNSSHEWIS